MTHLFENVHFILADGCARAVGPFSVGAFKSCTHHSMAEADSHLSLTLSSQARVCWEGSSEIAEQGSSLSKAYSLKCKDGAVDISAKGASSKAVPYNILEASIEVRVQARLDVLVDVLPIPPALSSGYTPAQAEHKHLVKPHSTVP